jgi:hypothetical protein
MDFKDTKSKRRIRGTMATMNLNSIMFQMYAVGMKVK